LTRGGTLALAAAVALAACHGAAPPRAPGAPAAPLTPPTLPPPTLPPPTLPPPPVAVDQIPDAVPRDEPRSRFGNPPFYDVFGRRYYVLASNVGYVERGVASWYGPGFHEVQTSTHESYDMYGMTAAHKTLPLPCYARVTNLQNGRSVVVRINDRGPFVANRIIDLSYTAAAKLDMLRNGTAMVEVRTLSAGEAAPGPTLAAQPDAAPTVAAPGPGLFVQAGAFASADNAQKLVEKLRLNHLGTVFIRENTLAGRKLYRVRLGPVADVAQFDRLVAALDQIGVHEARLALD
jgi:rare lipoprotein A